MSSGLPEAAGPLAEALAVVAAPELHAAAGVVCYLGAGCRFRHKPCPMTLAQSTWKVVVEAPEASFAYAAAGLFLPPTSSLDLPAIIVV